MKINYILIICILMVCFIIDMAVSPAQSDDKNVPILDQLRKLKTGDGSSCKSILEKHKDSKSGVYRIDPDGEGGYDPFPVYCDMTSDGGGWTVIFDDNNTINNCGQLCSSMGVVGFCNEKRLRMSNSFPSVKNESMCGSNAGINNIMIMTRGLKVLNNLHFSQMRYQITGKCGNQVSSVAILNANDNDNNIAKVSGALETMQIINTLLNTGIDRINLWQGDSINFCGNSNGCACELQVKHLSFR